VLLDFVPGGLAFGLAQPREHKVLEFSQFVAMLWLVRQELEARGLNYVYLDGRTTDRQARVDQCQNDPASPFFLISLKAGGVGLNLTAADYVIHLDPWWNPAVEMQASDRAHRIGQYKPVFIFQLIARDTVEDKILELQKKKRSLVASLVATEAGFFKSLSVEDVRQLFGRSARRVLPELSSPGGPGAVIRPLSTAAQPQNGTAGRASAETRLGSQIKQPGSPRPD
jgi:SNF2 family DNA or RNA helicase